MKKGRSTAPAFLERYPCGLEDARHHGPKEQEHQGEGHKLELDGHSCLLVRKRGNSDRGGARVNKGTGLL